MANSDWARTNLPGTPGAHFVDAVLAEAEARGLDTSELDFGVSPWPIVELTAAERIAEHTGNTEYLFADGVVKMPTAEVVLLANEAEWLRTLDRNISGPSYTNTRLSEIASHLDSLSHRANTKS